jgi:hypothetical protein
MPAEGIEHCRSRSGFRHHPPTAVGSCYRFCTYVEGLLALGSPRRAPIRHPHSCLWHLKARRNFRIAIAAAYRRSALKRAVASSATAAVVCRTERDSVQAIGSAAAAAKTRQALFHASWCAAPMATHSITSSARASRVFGNIGYRTRQRLNLKAQPLHAPKSLRCNRSSIFGTTNRHNQSAQPFPGLR